MERKKTVIQFIKEYYSPIANGELNFITEKITPLLDEKQKSLFSDIPNDILEDFNIDGHRPVYFRFQRTFSNLEKDNVHDLAIAANRISRHLKEFNPIKICSPIYCVEIKSDDSENRAYKFVDYGFAYITLQFKNSKEAHDLYEKIKEGKLKDGEQCS